MLLYCMKNMNRVEMFDCAIFFDTLLIKSHKMQIQLNPFSASLGKGAANLFAQTWNNIWVSICRAGIVAVLAFFFKLESV